MISWFYLKNGKVTGPVKLENIHKLVESKKIGGFDLIYRSDEKKWKPVIEFTEMRDFFESQEELVNPDAEVTGSYDLSQLVISQETQKETQWVILRILDRTVRPVKTEQLGPFSTSLVKKMIRQGDLSFQDYVWTDGMSQWELLVEQELLVPRVELPQLVESLTVESTVQVPQEKGDELLESVEVVQRGGDSPEPEVLPEEAGTEDLVTESRKQSLVKHYELKGVDSVHTDKLKVASLDKSEEKKGEVSKPKVSAGQKTLKSEWSFRLLQGVFGTFVVGGIIGIAFFLSYDPKKRDVMDFTHQMQIPASSLPQLQKKPPLLQKKNLVVAPKKTLEPVKKAPSYVKLLLKDPSGPRPQVEVQSDASRHYPANFLLTAAAGQILTHPSYHREWAVKSFDSRFRTVDFRSLGLREGWYTLLVKVGKKKALKTFFVGSKKVYNGKIRSYRKILGYQHQAEKEQMYLVLKDLIEHLEQLKKAKSSAWGQSMSQAQASLKRVQGITSKHLRDKNSYLWTVYWMQISDRSNELIELLKSFKKGASYSRIRRQEKKLHRLLSQVQSLKVVR